MADFLEPGGKDVLEEAAEKLHRVQRHLPRPVRSDTAIGEGDLAVVAGDDAMVADRHSEDVRGEIAQRGAAIARGLRVHHPVAPPTAGSTRFSRPSRARMSRNLARKRIDRALTGTRKSARDGSQRAPA